MTVSQQLIKMAIAEFSKTLKDAGVNFYPGVSEKETPKEKTESGQFYEFELVAFIGFPDNPAQKKELVKMSLTKLRPKEMDDYQWQGVVDSYWNEMRGMFLVKMSALGIYKFYEKEKP